MRFAQFHVVLQNRCPNTAALRYSETATVRSGRPLTFCTSNVIVINCGMACAYVTVRVWTKHMVPRDSMTTTSGFMGHQTGVSCLGDSIMMGVV